MPTTPHVEKHFAGSALVRDVVIGMADGLTVPFALAAGLSGAIDNPRIIVTAGVAEIVAGCIAMGLGGYLAGKTDVEHYESERAREERETAEIPDEEAAEVESIFRSYGLEGEMLDGVVEAIRSDRERWIDFMMRHELGLEMPDPGRARASALTIGGSYVVGGLIPLMPYFFVDHVRRGLWISIALTLVALLVFGYVKGRFTTVRPLRSAWQTVLVGGFAGTAAFLIARAIG